MRQKSKYYLSAIIDLSFLFLISCNVPSQKQKTTSIDSASIASAVRTPVDSIKTRWEYTEQADDMSDKSMKFASIEADDQLQFKFPYQGGSVVNLFVRKRRGKNDVILQVSKGQFLTGIDGGELLVKFDDQKPVTYSYTEPADGSTTAAFITNTVGFIAKLKKAKHLIIETEFYQEGPQHMAFEVEGLKWK